MSLSEIYNHQGYTSEAQTRISRGIEVECSDVDGDFNIDREPIKAFLRDGLVNYDMAFSGLVFGLNLLVR